MIKKNLHPDWHQAKIYCEGKIILEIGSTKKQMTIDVWSGNHPLYTGSKKTLDLKGRMEKFNKKYNHPENLEI